jgi:hypothetical protein
MANLSNMNGLTMPGQAANPALAPQPNASAAAPGPDAIAGLRSRLLQAHAMAKAQFDKTSDLVARADRVRSGLQSLTALGDMITPEDVIKEAGKLVAGGADPLVLAGVLADMPQNGGGEALQGWVGMHVQQAAAAEQQVMQVHALAQHHLGTTALHALQAHTGYTAVPATAPPANPLTGGPT